MRLRDRVGLSAGQQALASRLMELSLVGFVFVGIYSGEPGISVNSGVGLLVIQVPRLLERDYDFTMDPALVLWITTAVFLHGLGTIGLPGSGSFYTSVWWWDHLTHALSSSVVAGAGYAFARAVDEHAEDVSLPPAFTFAFLLLVVLAFGVFWEVIEHLIGVAADLAGSGSVLTQYGLEDTMLDLVFDGVGGIIVAVWGTAHLTDVTGAIRAQLERRSSGG
jgi:hypothetical protein